jgi:DNA-binding NtrC family response regulator
VHVESDAIDVLCRYPWPGNVRELENVVVRTMVSSGGGTIGVDALPPAIVMAAMGLGGTAATDAATSPTGATHVSVSDEIVPLAEVERRAIVQAVQALDGNLSLVARRLGVGRATLYRKLSQYGYRTEDQEPG